MIDPLDRTVESASKITGRLGRGARRVGDAITSSTGSLFDSFQLDEDPEGPPRSDAAAKRRRARTLHVEPHQGGWGVRLASSGETVRITSSRAAAYDSAIRWARREGRRVFLHREDGSIERIRCFGRGERGRNGRAQPGEGG